MALLGSEVFKSDLPDCLSVTGGRKDESLAQLHTAGVVWSAGILKILGQGGALQEMDETKHFYCNKIHSANTHT